MYHHPITVLALSQALQEQRLSAAGASLGVRKLRARHAAPGRGVGLSRNTGRRSEG
ncbi:MAG TPA: hypothetical protein VMS74_13530 [Acidimicrobiia bacterium]|nr:hypothetical protein [Acidimicrobiia bacterium]